MPSRPSPLARAHRRPSPPRRERCRSMTAARATIHGWLLLLPALVLLARSRTGRRSRPSSTASTRRRRPRRPSRFVGLDNYAAIVDDPVFWQSLCEQSLVRASARFRSRSRSRSLMALWVNDRIAGRALAAHGLLHADRAADDRGRQHLAVLLHAAIRPARADHRRCSACRRTTGSARKDTALLGA